MSSTIRPSSSGQLAIPPLRGLAGSPGIAIATALVLERGTVGVPRRAIVPEEIPLELQRYAEAVEEAMVQIEEVHTRVSHRLPAEHLKILEAYKAMLADPTLATAVQQQIEKKQRNAEWAVELSVQAIVREFDAMDDPYLRERKHDVEFVGERLQRALSQNAPKSVGAMRLSEPMVPAKLRRPQSALGVRIAEPTIIVAHDLSPADTAAMVREPIVGFVTEVGTRSSHTAIMARALEIPAVVGVVGAASIIRTGDTIVVDGLRGEVYVRPTRDTTDRARARGDRHASRTLQLRQRLREPTTLGCGTVVTLKANVELPTEALLAIEHGAEGIGLYRTEFLYIERNDLPSEDEQFELYRTIVQMTAPRPVTLRTFDLGGDKQAACLKLEPEINPALGLRAVRLALREEQTFLTQLRAMVRASAYGEVRIMVPMVASLSELRAVRKLLNRAITEVEAAGHEHGATPLGIMIEVPAAAVCADLFAREAAFFSIGTNDLVQYALAVDRGSQELVRLATAFDPAILRLIRMAAHAAIEAGIPVSVCGAMASDPLAALLLVGMGIRELSMEASAIAEIKETLRRATLPECEDLAEETLLMATAADVELAVAETFATRLSDILASDDFTAVPPGVSA